MAFPLWASVTLSEVRDRAIDKVPSRLDILQLPTLGTGLEIALKEQVAEGYQGGVREA